MTQAVQIFLAMVLERAPPDLPVGVLRKCAKRYEAAGRAHRASIPDCIQAARRLFEQEQAERQQRDDPLAPRPRPQAPTAPVSADVLSDLLRPEVEATRVEIFGSADPPFNDSEEAVAWIKARARGGSDDSARPAGDPDLSKQLTPGSDAVPQLWEMISKLANEIALCLGGPIELGAPRRVMLEFMDLQGSSMVVSRVHLPFDSKLVRLKSFAQTASNRTGFKEWALVAHVLVGVPLSGTVPPVEVSVDCAIPPRLPKTTVSVNKAKVRKKDLIDAHQQIEPLRVFASDSLDETDKAIIEVMLRLEPPPPKGKRGRGKYWANVQRELRKAGIEMSPRAIEMRRKRLSDKGEVGRLVSRRLPL